MLLSTARGKYEWGPERREGASHSKTRVKNTWCRANGLSTVLEAKMSLVRSQNSKTGTANVLSTKVRWGKQAGTLPYRTWQKKCEFVREKDCSSIILQPVTISGKESLILSWFINKFHTTSFLIKFLGVYSELTTEPLSIYPALLKNIQKSNKDIKVSNDFARMALALKRSHAAGTDLELCRPQLSVYSQWQEHQLWCVSLKEWRCFSSFSCFFLLFHDNPLW